MFNKAKIAIITHEVKLSYTNIILMKIWNLIALGEYLNDKFLANEGVKLLKEWIVYTYNNGITEFLSPVYYAIDLENLTLIYNFARNNEAKEIAKYALDFFWLEIMVNWYLPSNRLGGTHSRCYDRLYGHGALDKTVKKAFDLEYINREYSNVFDYFSFYQPDRYLLLKYIYEEKPRFVYAKWGEKEYNRYSHYLGKNFSVGTAEANYYNMDKTPLVINIGSGETTPIINFFMDGRKDYYGYKKIMESSGHLKSLHLMPFIVSIQNDSEVLFLASVKDNQPNLEALESIITIPSDSQIWINEKKLDIFNKTNNWKENPEPNNLTTFLNYKIEKGKTIIELVDKSEKDRIGISQIFSVKGGETYRILAKLKGGIIYLYLNYLDKEKKLIGEENIKRVICNENFFEYEFHKTAPENAEYCLVWIYSPSANITTTEILDATFQRVKVINEDKIIVEEIIDKSEFICPVYQMFSIKEQDTIFIHREDVVTVLKLIKAYDINNKEIEWYLFNDGLKYNALRLTATHSAEKTDKRGTIVIYSYTTEGIKNEDEFEILRNKVIKNVSSIVENKKGIIDVCINGINEKLRIKADINNEKRLIREGMKISGDFLLYVNGKDIGKELLKECSIIKKYLEKRQ